MNTHDTAVQVYSVLWCAENQNRTHTHNTCFGFTVGLPIPVFNPIKNLCPQKPTKLPLANALWPILQQCWAEAPSKRPDILTICRRLGHITISNSS